MNYFHNPQFIYRIVLLLKNYFMVKETSQRILYKTAILCLGKDITPEDRVPDDVACVEVWNKIFQLAFGFRFSNEVNTYPQFLKLATSNKFRLLNPLEKPEAGDTIISPTGLGNGSLPNGHIGIFGENGRIMSNDSYNKVFLENYSLVTWTERYKRYGGFPILIFRRI